MRKNAKYLLGTLLSFCFVVNVYAAECSYEEQVRLGNLASTVKVTYEAVDIDTGETYPDDMNKDENGNYIMLKYYEKGFDVKVLNVTEDIYIEVSNSLDEEEERFYNKDAENGIISLGVKKADKIVTYSIKVFGAKNGCKGLELRTFNVLVPRYNSYSKSSYCIENPDFHYCQEYTTDSSEIDFLTFDSEVKKYEEEKTKKEIEKKEQNKSLVERIKNFIKGNKKVVIIAVSSLVIIGVATILIIVIRKRRRLI